MKHFSPGLIVSAILGLLTIVNIAGCGTSNSPASNSGTQVTVPFAVTSISPASVPAGAAAVTLTVIGAGFESSSIIQVNGVSLATQYISSTRLTAVLPASSLATGASLAIAVLNGAVSTASGSPISLEVDNPVPAITGTSPANFVAGASPATVSVAGTGFVSATVIQLNGSARTTSYVDSTSVSVALTANDLSQAANLALVAVNPAPGGGTSATFALPVLNPIPGRISLTPSAIAAGKTTATSVSVTGTNFIAGSIVQVNGSPHATAVVSPTLLSFQLSVADQASAGLLTLEVVNPGPGGGGSPPATFDVTGNALTPAISSVTPPQIFAGSGDTGIYVSGGNLAVGQIVQWNGTNLPTSYFFDSSSGAFLTATVPASLLAATGTARITVDNPSATRPISNAFPIQIITPPPPTLTPLTTLAPTGTAATITLNGTNFTAASTVSFNGTSLPITYTSSTQASVTISASALTIPGIYPLTISNAGGTSSPLFVTVYVAIPNNSMIYNPVNGLFYLSVPSAAGAPYGNSVVSIDPVTGALGKPIFVGSEPNRLAITSDGRYLWVALDGAGAVRKVDLSTGTAGLQFSIGSNGDNLFTVSALAALPGAPDSVVVSTYLGIFTEPAGVSLAIYDNGVPRSSVVSFTYAFPWTLIVDAARKEIYGPGDIDNHPDKYNTYTYSDSGVALKSSVYSNLIYGANYLDEAQIVAGRMFTDYGQVVDPESGSLLGTLYANSTTAAQGSMTVDATLGKVFILENSFESYQLGAFNLADLSRTADAPIPVSLPSSRASYQYAGPTGNRLTRWGANGLAFRSTGGFISFRSNLVKDLSRAAADLSVSLTQPGATTTGGTTTYTATVKNNGPAPASEVALMTQLSSGVLTSIIPSQGACSNAEPVACDLGALTAGASATVTFKVLQTSAGNSAVTVHVNASETDPVPSNNQATSEVDVTGTAYNVAPVISSISPTTIASGSTDTVITVSGSGLSSNSTVLFNGTPLATSFASSTQLSAAVPAADLTTLGWASISVTNPAPGGGTSSALPLSIFSVLDLGANHILYDPYSRKIMASIGPGTSSVAANSIVAITPETRTVGTAVPVGSTPTNLALTSEGQILYTILPTIGGVARFNMLTQQPDFTVGGFPAAGYNVGLRDIATLPGSENAIAVDEGEYNGIALYDFDPTSKKATARGSATGIYTGTCPAFPDPNSLLAIDLYSSDLFLARYTVSATGLLSGSYPSTRAPYLNCFKVDGPFIFSNDGGVLTSGSPSIQVGVFEGMVGLDTYGYGVKNMEPDTSLQRMFFMTNNDPSKYFGTVDSITVYDQNTFMPISVLPMGFSEAGGNTDPNADTNAVDLIRWGQDGLAALTTSGQVYLLRGAAVVPELLNQNSAALLSASSAASIAHGSGNTLLTLTGGNFVPGVAVTWNGSYRTTKIVDATHVTVAIPASDLAQPGTATVAAVNPGAASSDPLTVNIN